MSIKESKLVAFTWFIKGMEYFHKRLSQIVPGTRTASNIIVAIYVRSPAGPPSDLTGTETISTSLQRKFHIRLQRI